MITYEVNRAELELVEKKLGDMKSKAPQVFKNAVNKTARQARKRIAQSAKGAYTVKQVGFNSHMKIKNASTGNLTASVDADGKPLTLVRFKNRAGSRHREQRYEATGQFARRKSVQAQRTGDAEGRQRQTPGQSVPFKLRSQNG